MTIKASKFTKFKDKINRKLIGEYGSDTGLGTDLMIKRYHFVLDDYGERTKTYMSRETCKGIIINSTDFELTYNQDLTIGKNDIRMLIPIEYTVVDTDTYAHEFILNSKIYILSDANAIGQVSNLTGVVRDITLTPKLV